MNYFIVGIKGAAMSNLAVLLKQMGHTVGGCDVAEEFITDPVLKQFGIEVGQGFDPSFLPQSSTVVYSAAHGGVHNPLVQEAIKRGMAVVSQPVLLGQLLDGATTKLAVSGCHGKTTTTSLLTYALIQLHADPSYIIGAPFFNSLPGGHYGHKDYFVIEADEYAVNPPEDKTPKLLHLHPTHVICTNIDFDHPDVYADLGETKNTFLTFFEGKKLFLCIDDPNLKSVLPRIKDATVKTYGFSESADLRIMSSAYSETASTFRLSYEGKDVGSFTVHLFGEKNILNAAGVILLLLDLGFTADNIRSAMEGFSSVKRRFELLYKGTASLFDDYGHHPAEIAATIDAARKRFPGKRIIVLFQPHTFSRTATLKDDFVRSLGKADLAIVAPIFPSAREQKERFSIASSDLEKLAKTMQVDTVRAASSSSDLLGILEKNLQQDDIVFTMGAGDIYKLKDDIIGIISRLKPYL